jgi:nucleotide-binding universal stress UspA family protein
MTIKHVLACIDGTSGDRAVLDYASQIAQRLPLHIDVLHVHFDIHSIPKTSWYARQIDHLFKLTEEVDRLADEAAARAHQHFEEWYSQNNLPLVENAGPVCDSSIAWHEIKGHEIEVIARKGRSTDLTIIARPGFGNSSLALEAALFETGRPVLIVPEMPAVDLFYRPIIAWNDSTEAAQAVGHAIPFLRNVEGSIEILTVVESKHNINAGDLLRYLNWHGIASEVTTIDDASRSVGASLLARAELAQAGLIVMGAYTHGHYRQFVFGGVTDHFMRHARVPVLMTH